DGETKKRLKAQLAKIPSANISTIHSFCARLIRTYFYALDGVDGGFDIISSDDAVAKELKILAVDGLFDRLYEEDDADFKLLLSCYVKKRSDASLKKLLWEKYDEVRQIAHYKELLSSSENLYTEQGFSKVCNDYLLSLKKKIAPLICAVKRFRAGFKISKKADIYGQIFSEMEYALKAFSEGGLFDEKPPLSVTRKPVDGVDDKEAGAQFKAFKDGITKKYNALRSDLADENIERERFFESGKIACAFSKILLKLDEEYTAVKLDENKLDYSDLEHLTLELLSDDKIKGEINSGFKYVFVDEYQDVNPVQEEIISSLSGETFMVGDVKQAIYGFRGSKSVFFSEKYRNFEKGFGNALKLSSNFRSSDGVINFVNGLFSEAMTPEVCGVNYAKDGVMRAGGQYPAGEGEAKIRLFGKEEEEDSELTVYSVSGNGEKARHTREGLALLKIVEEELQKKHYDLKQGKYVETQPGDICILTRKNKGESTEGIVRALLDEGRPVAGAQEANICELAEVKQMLDILSLIDNAEQDIPLVTALLSPIGGFCEDELAQIRIAFTNSKEKLSFRSCCEKYARLPGEISRKLGIFGGQLRKLRSLKDVLTAGELIDELLETYGLEGGYGAGGELKLKNVLRLAEEGADLPLSDFLQKIKAGGYNISAPAPAPSDSIQIMSMHASKGLEFPVVIIADICKSFKGQEYSEIPFDEVYGFAPKYYDRENLLTAKTVLRRLIKVKEDEEELNNELNLFYVACTRAMCSLHILAEEVKPYDEAGASDAKCYADLFDMSKFVCEEVTPKEELSEREEKEAYFYKPDEETVKKLEKSFMLEYGHKESVDLPVKSSASAILKLKDFEPYYARHELFGGEGETGTEKGTAYHRFLELCDFSLKNLQEIEEEKLNFLNSGRISKEQYDLLNSEELSEILKMPVFSDLSGAKLMREQEFLCRLEARDLLDTPADDAILVQGAIDLLAEGDFGIKIIDYKYSKKDDEKLIETYKPQLDLYKKAVAVITGYSAESIKTTIVNIFKRRQIDVN
ncbi:MAG: UvrD-helicase domain-containing protein, partial [Clostridia bacterium]|nr:UvrD-helicase domain-containing protein [Clostridia bacterium]